jgi:hypothetical protein
MDSVTSSPTRSVILPWYVEAENDRQEDNEIIFNYDPGIPEVSIFQEAFSGVFLPSMSPFEYIDVNRYTALEAIEHVDMQRDDSTYSKTDNSKWIDSYFGLVDSSMSARGDYHGCKIVSPNDSHESTPTSNPHQDFTTTGIQDTTDV